MTTVTLYIEPDRGPIKPVTLDLLAIEQEIQTSRARLADWDKERLNLVCGQIKKQHPRVMPESNLPALALIMARFSNAGYFNGAVLRLSGEIDPDVSDECKKTIAQLKHEIDRLSREILALRGQLLAAQNGNINDKASVQQLDAEKKRLEQSLKDAQYQKMTLQQQLQQSQAEVQRIRSEHSRDIQSLQGKLEQAMHDYAGLTMQIERWKEKYEEHQKMLQLREQELARLRRDFSALQSKLQSNGENHEKILREKENQIQELQREVEKLQKKIRDSAHVDLNSSPPDKGVDILESML